ncbi:helix-turn-helix transcriptional regulator [Flocculibacter collagenilyticus]|uniref:helix-turn-helix transcriptional regulator n=1 Tax=Flocculibacter collagenilyticus TaxID=2744479 RepID=UPI0018F340D5|nr:metalloregulator ArsR/SmtB family transcription factor [Flocculibacter collagenilyticus]
MAKKVNSERILYLLKSDGPQTAQTLAHTLDMTSMGSRQHLQVLESEGLVSTFDKAEKRGRPAKYWQLTPAGHQRFPDRHAELTIQMLDSVKSIFGDEGLNKMITQREQHTQALYLSSIKPSDSLENKVAKLTHLREQEGYMAVYEPHQKGFLLIENHCPICAAAASCQNFCRSELATFRTVLGESVHVERVEHILNEARRCSYYIYEQPATK